MTTLTPDQIERRVEKAMDRLDALFMAGKLSQTQYDSQVRDLDKWADGEYFANKRVAP